MTLPQGDSHDGFVFPPFIPPSARPAEAAPRGPEPEPSPVQAAAGGGNPMPWDDVGVVADEPAVADSVDLPLAADDSAEPEDAAEGEDLPWLELPGEGNAAPAAEPVAAAPADAEGEAFPDWMAWSGQDEEQAADELAAVPPVAGLETPAPMGDIAGFVAPTPASSWADTSAVTADDAFDFDALLDPVPAAQPDADAFAAEGESTPVVTESMFDPDTAFEADDAFDGDAAFGGDADAAAEPDPFTAAAVAETEAVVPADPEPEFLAPDDEDEDADDAVGYVPRSVPIASTEFDRVGTRDPAGRLDDVAARLEAIARTLRERPNELFSGAAGDPLALLVTGYVLGYTHGQGA